MKLRSLVYSITLLAASNVSFGQAKSAKPIDRPVKAPTYDRSKVPPIEVPKIEAKIQEKIVDPTRGKDGARDMSGSKGTTVHADATTTAVSAKVSSSVEAKQDVAQAERIAASKSTYTETAEKNTAEVFEQEITKIQVNSAGRRSNDTLQTLAAFEKETQGWNPTSRSRLLEAYKETNELVKKDGSKSLEDAWKDSLEKKTGRKIEDLAKICPTAISGSMKSSLVRR